MKSIDFKRQGSTIRVRQETKAKKPANWDRIIYILVLTVLGGVLLNYFCSRWLFVHADGQILFENVNIRLTTDSRIMKYYVDEDDSINVGDTLFSYEFNHLVSDNSNSSNTQIQISDKKTNYDDWVWLDKEIYNLQNKISQDKIIISKNTSLILKLDENMKRITQEVLLGVLSKEKIESANTERSNIEAQSQQMKEEISHAEQMISDLNAKKSFYMRAPANLNVDAQTKIGTIQVGNPNGSINNGLNYYLSPISGAVNRILTSEFEVALKQDEIISLRSNKQMYIKAFIGQEDINDLKVNDLVNIEFPNGEKQVGKVKRFYYATYILPDEFQKKFEPTTRDVAVDIYPLDSNNAKDWQNFYKMSVKITKCKYF